MPNAVRPIICSNRSNGNVDRSVISAQKGVLCLFVEVRLHALYELIRIEPTFAKLRFENGAELFCREDTASLNLWRGKVFQHQLAVKENAREKATRTQSEAATSFSASFGEVAVTVQRQISTVEPKHRRF